jgi:hypothetical protein
VIIVSGYSLQEEGIADSMGEVEFSTERWARA